MQSPYDTRLALCSEHGETPRSPLVSAMQERFDTTHNAAQMFQVLPLQIKAPKECLGKLLVVKAGSCVLVFW